MSLHVAISGWLLGPPSGANRRLLALVEHAAALLEPDERITVLHARSFAPPVAPRGITWSPIDIPAGPPLRRLLAERRLLPRVLRELGATVLDHGFLPTPPVAIPTCLLVHDVRGVEGLAAWPRVFARLALVRSCARATAVVVPSQWTRDRLRDIGAARTAIEVVPNGVELPPADDAPAADHLLHVGHLERRKNLELLLHALRRQPSERRPCLVLAGRDAGAGTRLRRLAARTGIAANVVFAGTVTEPELAHLYRTARAVVVPSLHEGFGLCALEGLAHGRPVLASRAGALPEIVGDQGILLPPDDAGAWAMAIAAPSDDSPAARSARRARAATFRWALAARALLTVWRRLDADASRGPVNA